MSTPKFGRREATRRALTVLGAAAFAPAALTACGGDDSLSCTDTSGLSQAEIVARTSQHYTDTAPGPDRCATCHFFTSAGDNACGTCQVLQGPISPQGYCDLWQART